MRFSMLPVAALAACLMVAGSVHAAPPTTRIPDDAMATAAQLRETALASDLGYEITRSLTTEVGPRLAGSPADARAVAWAVDKFEELGFDKVWTEPVTFPKWVRRSESGQVLGAHAQPLVLTALGGSPGGTVEGEVVRFADLAALKAAPAGSLDGKIAFVDYQMQRAKDGHGYGKGWQVRHDGPSAAIRAGASGFLMRSAGTGSHRSAHTGMTSFDDGLTPIPSAALAAPDADQLTRLLELDEPIRARLALDVGWDGKATSYNVIGEITGASKPDEIILLGAHLDSWDTGTGALDDAAGVGLTMAAAKLIGDLEQRPARSIRVVAFANEEQGLYGGREYARVHADEVGQHIIGAESDFGAGRIYAFDTNAPAYAQPAVEQIAAALAPLGIAHTPGKGGPESDIGWIAKSGMTWAWLGHDGTNYFDYHHTPDDTFDKIDPDALAQNVAAYAVFAYLAASAQGDFGSAARASAIADKATDED